MERREAKAIGERFYDNGKRCPADHSLTVRYTITGKCLECCKLERLRFREQRRAESMVRSVNAVWRPIDVARRMAKAEGLLFYDNGRRCPRDHQSTVRYVVSGKCLECSKTEGVRYSEARAVYTAAHASEPAFGRNYGRALILNEAKSSPPNTESATGWNFGQEMSPTGSPTQRR